MGASNGKQQSTESNEESSGSDIESNEEKLVSSKNNSRDGSHLDSSRSCHPHYSDQEILRTRYSILNKGRRDSKPLRCMEAFNKPPYNSEHHFYRGLVKELVKSSTADTATTNDTITQEMFIREIVRWQDLDESGKLSLMFTCMLNTTMDDGPAVLTHDVLWRVLCHSLDNSMYSETECKQLAKRMIDAMADNQEEDDESSQRPATEQEVTLSQYKKWITRNMMKEKLKESLELKISNLK